MSWSYEITTWRLPAFISANEFETEEEAVAHLVAAKLENNLWYTNKGNSFRVVELGADGEELL